MNDSTEKEIWKDVKGYEGLYRLNNNGEVFSVDRYIVYSSGVKALHKGRRLKTDSLRGYERVVLSKGGKAKRFQLHRLVAMNFIENPNNKEQVNHIDGNKKNNRLSNLEWCTAQENEIHSYRVLGKQALRGEQKSQSKLTESDVFEIRDLYKHGYLQREIANLYKVSRRHISDIVNKKRWGWL